MNIENPIVTVGNIISRHCLTHHISARSLCKEVGVSSGYLSEINRGLAHSVVLKFKGHVEFPAELIEWAKEERRMAKENSKPKAPTESHWWHGVKLYPWVAQMRLRA